MGTIEISEQLRAAAIYLGEAGERWIQELPHLVANVEGEWRIACGRALAGGNFGYVAEAVTADGQLAVLKVALPPTSDGLKQELRTLQLAQGDPYARLIRFDEERRILLLERLGRSLAELGWPVDRQIAESVSTVARGWRPVDGAGLASGAGKARWLAEFIGRTWGKLDRPCSEQAVERAIAYANERVRALDGQQPVLVHGDAHPWNILEANTSDVTAVPEKRFRLIDPEGLASEPAHDLGVILRGWNEELIESDTATAALDRCAAVARQTGIDHKAIWQWSYIERVSSGLFLLDLGHRDQARAYLRVADRLAAVDI
jgi:streptomycin 6-kinase